MSSEPAGWTVALAWKVMVAGGMGTSIERMPPRRTGTVTATSWPVTTWRAFHPSAATATYMRRSATPYTTPLDRGSPAVLTWLTTANEAFASACQTASLLVRALPVAASSNALADVVAGSAVVPFVLITDLLTAGHEASLWYAAAWPSPLALAERPVLMESTLRLNRHPAHPSLDGRGGWFWRHGGRTRTSAPQPSRPSARPRATASRPGSLPRASGRHASRSAGRARNRTARTSAPR